MINCARIVGLLFIAFLGFLTVIAFYIYVIVLNLQ